MEPLEQAGAPSVTVYDNGGETCDRYSVIIRYPDGYAALFGMSWDAKAFNQFCGEMVDSKPYPGQYEEGEHLGRRLARIPDAILGAVLGRTSDIGQSVPICSCGEPCLSDEGTQSDEPKCEGCIDQVRDFHSNPYDR